MASKYYQEMQTTDNPKVYRMARKGYLASGTARGIRCSFCPYHAKENSDKKFQKSWKKQSKRRRQYRPL